MKIAPLLAACGEEGFCHRIQPLLVHTGQHYDYQMSKIFFDELDIPEPHYFLSAGSGSHAVQTAKIMVEFEKVCQTENPDLVVVVGDVNSTLACSIVAKKLHIKVAHVEAGLRSGNLAMPEEINRLVTDAIADLLFVTEQSGMENLSHEGKREDQVFLVGNIMIDTLLKNLQKLGPKPAEPDCQAYGVVTLHRPSNVDDEPTLRPILEALRVIADDLPLVFPIHPRTKERIEEFGLRHLLEHPGLRLKPPLPYLEFLELWRNAALMLTDSGGLQEETTALGIPCFTLRNDTERPITIEQGTNCLVGTTKEAILQAFAEFRAGKTKTGRIPPLWDGKTAQRILDIILS